jgi:hypothetical protein
MAAQGWQRDPFSLHEDRWFSDGQPTRLVRDQGVEIYDEPPPGDLPAPAGEVPAGPVSSEQAGLASARLLSGRIAANAEPARNWRYWTAWPPCLLTLALAVLVAIGLISSPMNGSVPGQEGVGSNPGNPAGWILLMEAGLIVATIAAIVVLYAGADRHVNRRACALAGWVIAALAYGWAVGIGFLSTLAP